MKVISIIGVGLIGGSLGLAIKKRNESLQEQYYIIGVGRNEERLALAKQMGAIDEYTTNWADGVKKADIVVICTPVDIIASTVKTVLPHLKPEAVISDAGSSKSQVLKDVKRVMKNTKNIFIGAHPLAGSEKTGIKFADSELYKNACVVLAYDKNVPKNKISEIQKMWQITGAYTMPMEADKHDKLVAATSHLPHVLAFSLCLLVESLNKHDNKTKNLIAGSFRDLTRIADANPRDWAVICSINDKNMKKMIDEFIKSLNIIKKSLKSYKKLENIFTKANLSRKKILKL